MNETEMDEIRSEVEGVFDLSDNKQFGYSGVTGSITVTKGTNPVYSDGTITLNGVAVEKHDMGDRVTISIDDNVVEKEKSDGSSASYYDLPEGATQLQDLISFKNMNAQMGEIGRAWYRYGQVAHSEKMRDINKILFYAQAEKERLLKYGD